MSGWTPFGANGKLRVVVETDAWWKRQYARLRGWPIWRELGYIDEAGKP